MQTMNKTKDVFLTKAQFEARKTANTLEEGIIYHTTDETVLTPTGVKTLFGKSLLKDSEHPEDNNISLYQHNLSLTINGVLYYTVIYSSNNLVIDSVQDLTTVTKGHGQLLAIGSNKSVAIIAWQGSVWFNVLGEEGQDNNVTSVTDSVYPI